MLRRIAILSLTIAAILVAVPGSIGYFAPVYCGYSFSNRHHAYIFFADGLLRVYGYQANEPIVLTSPNNFRNLVIYREADGSICQRISHARPGQVPPYAWVSSTFPSPPAPTGTTTIRLTGVRTSITAPVLALIAYPVVAALRDRMRLRRRKSGHCRTCEYNLTGNTSGICPECGTAVIAEQAG